jgi:hypothetical protein
VISLMVDDDKWNGDQPDKDDHKWNGDQPDGGSSLVEWWSSSRLLVDPR